MRFFSSFFWIVLYFYIFYVHLHGRIYRRRCRSYPQPCCYCCRGRMLSHFWLQPPTLIIIANYKTSGGSVERTYNIVSYGACCHLIVCQSIKVKAKKKKTKRKRSKKVGRKIRELCYEDVGCAWCTKHNVWL